MGAVVLVVLAVVVIVVVVVVAVVIVVEASAPRANWGERQHPLGFSGKNLKGLRKVSKVFCLVASSLEHQRSQCSVICVSSLQRGHSGSVEMSRRLA